MTDFVYLAAKWNWFRILSFTGKSNLSHNITNMIGLSICFLMTRPPSPIRNGLYHNISHWKWCWTQIYVTYPSLFPSSSQVSDSRIVGFHITTTYKHIAVYCTFYLFWPDFPPSAYIYILQIQSVSQDFFVCMTSDIDLTLLWYMRDWVQYYVCA